MSGAVEMLEVPLGTYRISVASGILAQVGGLVASLCPAHRYALVTDDTVAPLYADRVLASFGSRTPTMHTVRAGEQHKTRESWARLTDELLAAGHGRDSALVALGGGVVGDLAGFVAATFMRGIPYVQVPTTLLAMIDASIGGKTGVDTTAGKNLVGAFHQPSAVLADPSALETLPIAQLRAGLSEALKHGAIADEAYFDFVGREAPALLARHPAPTDAGTWAGLVHQSVRIKASVVERDEREGGLRKILNFGHTLGHAVELESGFSMLHGEAIAVGMTLEAELAERLGIAAPGTRARIESTLSTLGLPTALPGDQTPQRVLGATRLDKKARAGAVEYALPRTIGAMAGADSSYGIRVPDELVLAVLRDAAGQTGGGR
jgi:3-dehydroquinate synthase